VQRTAFPLLPPSYASRLITPSTKGTQPSKAVRREEDTGWNLKKYPQRPPDVKFWRSRRLPKKLQHTNVGRKIEYYKLKNLKKELRCNVKLHYFDYNSNALLSGHPTLRFVWSGLGWGSRVQEGRRVKLMKTSDGWTRTIGSFPCERTLRDMPLWHRHLWCTISHVHEPSSGFLPVEIVQSAHSPSLVHPGTSSKVVLRGPWQSLRRRTRGGVMTNNRTHHVLIYCMNAPERKTSTTIFGIITHYADSAQRRLAVAPFDDVSERFWFVALERHCSFLRGSFEVAVINFGPDATVVKWSYSRMQPINVWV